MSSLASLGWVLRTALAGLVLGVAATAGAQEAPPTAIFRTQTSGEVASLGGAVDRVLRSALDEVDLIRVTGTLALDLEQAQLGLGCLAESAECFGTMAEQNEVTMLIIPRLEPSGDEVVLTLQRFDDRDDSLRQVTRRLPNESSSVLDSVRPLVRELFELPEPAEGGEGTGGEGAGGEGAGGEGIGGGGETPPDDGIGAGGPVLLGIGAAALIGGVVAGVLHSSSKSDYEDTPVTRENVDDVRGYLDSAQRRGRAATALFIAGGVVAATGLIWLLVDAMGGDSEADDTSARLRPTFAAGREGVEAGVVLEGVLW